MPEEDEGSGAGFPNSPFPSLWHQDPELPDSICGAAKNRGEDILVFWQVMHWNWVHTAYIQILVLLDLK